MTGVVELTVLHLMGCQIVGTLILTFVSDFQQKEKYTLCMVWLFLFKMLTQGNVFMKLYSNSWSLVGMLSTVWKDKLLSIATDGARNMTGRVAGAVTRLENVAHPGFFCVWCAAHQLDLVLQHLMSVLLQEEF